MVSFKEVANGEVMAKGILDRADGKFEEVAKGHGVANGILDRAD